MDIKITTINRNKKLDSSIAPILQGKVYILYIYIKPHTYIDSH